MRDSGLHQTCRSGVESVRPSTGGDAPCSVNTAGHPERLQDYSFPGRKPTPPAIHRSASARATGPGGFPGSPNNQDSAAIVDHGRDGGSLSSHFRSAANTLSRGKDPGASSPGPTAPKPAGGCSDGRAGPWRGANHHFSRFLPLEDSRPSTGTSKPRAITDATDC